MARPLRVNIEGGWYHVMSRGIERRAIFLDTSYFFHFLDLLGEMSLRFRVEVHAYVLLENHYHLVVRTPDANLSRAMHWLNVSYSAWLNAKRQRVGHVFQGRFRSTLIDGNGSWLLDMSAYVHLNPVRISALGLGKSTNRAEALGLAEPDREQVQVRLKTLRAYRWSSYRSYGNYGKPPSWLSTEEILKRAGGCAAYRLYVQERITRGWDPGAFPSLMERVAVGGKAFLDAARTRISNPSREHAGHLFARQHIRIERIIAAVEKVKGEPWSAFQDRYGDWGKSMVLYLARQHGSLTLREISEQVGGLAYKNVSLRVRRFDKQLAADSGLQGVAMACEQEMMNDET